MRRRTRTPLAAVALLMLWALMPVAPAQATTDIWTFSDDFVDSTAAVNGCGSQGAGFDFVPDTIGYADFGEGCVWHDQCYGTEGMPREYCDLGMFAKHLDACGPVPNCAAVAVLYFGAVAVAGGDPYADAQAQARFRRQGPRKVATSRGDPHLTTFDGRRYSFMAVGDFNLVTRGDTSLVQTRFHPLDQSTSITTGVAVQLGSDRIVAIIDPTADPTTNGITVTINGAVFDDVIAELTDGIITVARRSTSGRGVITVRGHDGFQVDLVDFGLYLDVSVHLSEALEDRAGGLLGDVARYTDTELVLADTNPVFVSQFRLDAQRSWFPPSPTFDYFGDDARSYPRVRLSLDDFPPDDVTAARQTCEASGVAVADVDTCALDVVVTGDNGFARRTGVSTAVATGGPMPGAPATSDAPTAQDLIDAVVDGDVDAVRALLVRGAKPNAVEGGLHPMTAALSTGDAVLEMLTVLLDAGADVHGGVGRNDDSGITPLSGAALNERADIVELLVAAGARWDWGAFRNVNPQEFITDPATLAALDGR
jgi:hypothetical protein